MLKAVRLSKSEHEVIVLLSQGYRRDEMVKQLGITRHGVDSRLDNLYVRLSVHCAAQALARGRELGLIE